MWRTLLLFPQQASTTARPVDTLYFFLIAVSAFFACLIFGLIAYFIVKYRRRPGRERAEPTQTHIGLEIAWTGIPLLLTGVMFIWGAKLFFNEYNPPAGATEIFVVGKQWMWKFQHPEGRMEINELHVPRGQPVKLTMISEDVIHDLFVPAFRVKKDVLPGRYTTVWFEATTAGSYHLFCSQYCGTQHSKMGGWVHVMEPVDYAKWIDGPGAGEPLAVAGAQLFQKLGCAACHLPQGNGQGPSLVGVFGQPVKLASGRIIEANEDYIRDTIAHPGVQVVAGYQPIMPTFKGLVGEDGMQQIIAYIKSLGKENGAQSP
jgi:cytochrome c oxidase subunit II